MLDKKYASKKKVTTQNISISPSLKDWIKKYVNEQHEEMPEDERFKSISSFYCSIMEEVMKIFEIGKSLDDFKKVQDVKIKSLYDQLSHRMFIPFIEPEVLMNRYLDLDFKSTIRFFFMLRKFLIENMDPSDLKSVKLAFDRIRNRYLAGTLTKNLNMDVRTKEGGGKHFIAIVEHSGNFRNLHYVDCKMMAEIMGFVGMRITDLHYSLDDLYYRMDLESTDTLFNSKLVKKERVKLLKENVSYMTNYFRTINDDAHHLWIKMAAFNDILVSFKDQHSFDKMIEKIEEDVKKYESPEEFKVNLLRFFEKLHWIRIINEDDLTFQLDLSEETHSREIKLLLGHLSKHGKAVESNGNYYWEE